MTSTQPPPLAGLHHLKLIAKDLQTTHDFYVSVLGFIPHPELTHRRPTDGSPYGYIISTPPPSGVATNSSKTMVEIRQAASDQQVEGQKGTDPITWAVSTQKDLQDWVAWLDTRGVRHSKVLRGVAGWVAVAEDPDGRMVRLYTLESHEWDNDGVEWDEEWLGKRV